MGASDALVGTSGYEGFFGFQETPFSLAPNTRFRFASASHEAALAQVTHALQRREPIVVVTGEIGTGKTLLCRTVVENLDSRTFLSVVSDPMLGRDDLLKHMLQDFGVISKDRTQTTIASRADLVHALNEFLLSLAPLGAHAVVVLDEAQHAQPEVLEEVRLLSNAHDERGAMLQIMLVGQDDLASLLTRPELRQLRERVSRRVRLDPLNRDEVFQYIEHRLSVARDRPMRTDTPGARALERALAEWNGQATGVEFAPAALVRIAELSQGIPRRINLLCDRALEYAFAAQSRLVDTDKVDSAARALQLFDAPSPVSTEPPPAAAAVPTRFDFRRASRASRRNGQLAAFVAAAVFVTIAATWFVMRRMDGNVTSDAPPPSPAPRTEAAAPSPPPTATPSPARAAVPEPASGSQSPLPEKAAPPTTGVVSDRFEIVVASFRTNARASAVAGDLGALGQPARQRVANGWNQVLVGPFSSRSQADQAQRELERAGYSGSQIVIAER